MKSSFLKSFRRVAPAVAAFIFTAGASVCGAADVYIRFMDGTGNWAGAATDPGRAGWCKLDSVTASVENAITLSGTGAGTGKAVFNPIVFTKKIDRLTPMIFANLTAGQALTGSSDGDVTIDFVEMVNNRATTVFRIEAKTAYFTQTAAAAADGDEAGESVSMICGALRYTHWPILPNGAAGTPIVRVWNQLQNRAQF